MKIEENTNLLNRVQTRMREADNVKDKKNHQKQSQTIQASTLHLAEDKIAEKRKQAQEMVKSLLENVFSSDQKIDDDLAERLKHIDSLLEENEGYGNTLKDIKEQKESLKEYYGITDDNKEGQNLDANTLKDYQKQALELDEAEKEYRRKIAENQKTIIEENAVIRGVGIERLKSHEMVDAQKQSDQITIGANQEIIGMLYEEVKNNQDEKIKEEQEAAEEKKEEKEAFEKRLEATKTDQEKRTNNKDDMGKMYQLGNSLNAVRKQSSGNTLDDIKKSLSQIVSELQLISEDLKGLVVDENQ